VQAYRIDRARFARLAVPALQLTGGNSPPPVRAVSDMLDATLPDIRTVVMPGQQHIAMDTAPDMVVDAVLDFWREIAGA
jgi:pimeloyl-ACP methyl ester carboxylesterase